MVTRAYAEDYVTGAQRVLGDAVDFAVMSLGLEPDVFGKAFAVSDASRQFGSGNPRYVAGMNGCELARKILEETHTPFQDTADSGRCAVDENHSHVSNLSRDGYHAVCGSHG